MIFLSKIILKNFKIFGGEPYVISFEGSRLILLDGPNGYGKTSIFDAIELGLTGNIDRLISLDDRQHPDDIVVAYQGTENVEIILEFKDENSNLKIFQRKLKSSLPKSSKKISKFAELWEINEIVDGTPVPLNQHALDEYFNCKDFSRDFLLFHYVQQEDTARFLKNNNEINRAEKLAQLFGNTSEADEKLTKLREFSRKVVAARKRTNLRLEEIKRLYNINDNASIEIVSNERHFYALPWLAEVNETPFWDAITIPELNQEKLNSSLMEIVNIKNLIEHQSSFFRYRRFENAIQQREVLELYIGYSNSISQYDFYVSLSQKYNLIKDAYSKLKTGEFLKIYNNINNFDTIFEALSLAGSFEFEAELRSLAEKEDKANGLNSIYSELLKHHDSMTVGLKKIPSVTSCLLCGQDYQSHDALSHAMAQHGHLLRSELSGQDKLLVAARDAFNKTHFFPLLQACSSFLEITFAPSQEDFLFLTKARNMRERFIKLRSWLMSEGIEHDDLLVTNFPVEGGFDKVTEATDQLCERILGAIGVFPDSYYEANSSNVFDRIYRDYFNNHKDKVNRISIDQLDDKESYIKNLYFNSMKEISEELAKLSKQIKLLDRAANDVAQLVDIVSSRIKKYRKILITDIEIPFYIYSGKILQTHQAGLGHGILIKDPKGDDGLKNVRLVSNWESDHDILNTMSSGQISAVVIALTLSLNKVYAAKFSSILIDDPVQTMDDINMSSLVEVLRNDFCEKQIILSTHEAKVARYFTYKYLKHDQQVKIINLMQRKEYVPRDKFLYRSSSSETK